MSASKPTPTPGEGEAHRDPLFPPTDWTQLLGPIQQRSPAAEQALEQLCHRYRPPLRAYVRFWGFDHHEADDVVQGFIASLLERRALEQVTRSRGRFRSFLTASLQNYLVNRHHAARAQKRGGGAEHLPLDAAGDLPAADAAAAEKALDREWAWSLVEQTLTRIERSYQERNRTLVFESLRGFLPGRHEPPSRTDLAGQLGMNLGTLDKAVHDLRRRFRDTLRALVSELVSTPEEVEDELRYLISVVG